MGECKLCGLPLRHAFPAICNEYWHRLNTKASNPASNPSAI